jgi:uncharacterized membrane protein
VTTRTWFLALAAAVAALAAGLFIAELQGDAVISDTPVYRTYGERIANGDVPYRDFRVEYPPGALAPFVVPALVSSSPHGFDATFETLMVVALIAAAVLIVLSLVVLGGSTTNIVVSVAAFLAGVALLGPFVLTRFDLYAATLTLAAVCAILYRRRVLGPVLLGVAIATKIYPAVLLPLLVARIWRREGRPAALTALALSVGTSLLIYLPFAILAPEGVMRSVWRQLGRPLQIESLGSSVLLALHHALGMPLSWASGSGSQNLTGTVAAVASGLTTIVGVAALVLVWVCYARGDVSDARFVRYAAAAVVAFVAFGKVLSPQFLVWLLAIVVLVQGVRGIAAITLLVAACALTRVWFPSDYWDLVKQFDPTASWLVLLRDLVLVAVFATLVVGGSSRSRARELEAA